MSKKPIIVQLDHPVHNRSKKSRANALKVLEMVKSQHHLTIYLPKGHSAEFEKLKKQLDKKKEKNQKSK